MRFDFKVFRKKISEKQDFALFDEIEKCYKTNALRMAYIATWIAIAESLRNKIAVMAEKDSLADKAKMNIEESENKHFAVDRLILDKAKELSIISDVDYPQIEYILTMRNLYAHPYNIAPTIQEVELAIAHAVEKVLSVPPLLRKPYIDKLMERLQKDRNFIDDLPEKIQSFTLDVTPRFAPHLYPYTLKCLLYRLSSVITDPDKIIFAKRITCFARTFIGQVKPNFNHSEWDLSEKFNDFPEAISEIFKDSQLWKLLPESIQDRALGWLLYPPNIIASSNGKEYEQLPSAENVYSSLMLFKDKHLTPRQEIRFQEWVGKSKLEYVKMWRIPLEYYVDRVIKTLAVRNYYVQNPAASCLWALGPTGMDNISSDKKNLLGRNILQSADGGAKDSQMLLKNSLLKKILWPRDFIKGILYECFINEKLEFRCKHEYLEDALLCTIRCIDSNEPSLFAELLKDIGIAKPKFGEVFLYKEETLSVIIKITSVLSSEENSKYLRYLTDLMETVKNKSAMLGAQGQSL